MLEWSKEREEEGGREGEEREKREGEERELLTNSESLLCSQPYVWLLTCLLRVDPPGLEN